METAPNDPLTSGVTLGGGKTTKDPTGWPATQNATVDTTGLNFPGLIGMQTFAKVYQAIESDALHGTAGGQLWGTIRPILIAGSGTYTKKELSSKGWITKDASQLQAFLSGLHNTNSSNPTAPLSVQNWINQRSTDVATTGTTSFTPSKILSASTTSTAAQQEADVLNNYVIPRAKALGSNATAAQLNTIASKVYNDGTYSQSNIVDNAILGNTDVAKAVGQDQSANPTNPPLGGAIGDATDQFTKLAGDYGIPVPKDPNQLATFVKNAVGPGESTTAFTEYLKNQAVLHYPWMKGALESGGTVKGYLQPYASQIANTLGISPDSINWTDPKWQSVVASKDPTGISTPKTLDQAMTTIKTDPRFAYNQTAQAKNDAYGALSQIGSMFGFGQ